MRQFMSLAEAVQTIRKNIGQFLEPLTIQSLIAVAGLAFVFQSGPELQRFVFAVGNAGRPTLYQMAFGDDLVAFPTFREWLINEYFLMFLLVSAFAYCASCRAKTSAGFVYRFTISSFFLITAIDIYITYNNGDFGEFYQNIIGNLVGPAILSIVFLVVLRFAEAFSIRVFNTSKSMIGPLVFFQFFLISSIVFVASRTLFSPLPSQIYLKSTNKYFLAYAPNEGSKRIEPRAVTASAKDASEVNLGGENLATRWQSQGGDQRKLTLSFFVNCYGESVENLAKMARRDIVFDIKKLAIVQADGPIFSSISSDERINIKPSGSNKLNMFWNDVASGGKLSATIGFSNPVTMKLIGDGIIRQSLTASMIVPSKNTRKFDYISAKFVVTVDGVQRRLSFSPSKNLNLNSKHTCKSIPVEDSVVQGIDLEALLEFSEIAHSDLHYDADSALHISSKVGHAAFEYSLTDEGNGARQSDLSALALSDASSLKVDNTGFDLPRSNIVNAQGDISIERHEDGTVEAKGLAHALWVDKIRVNKTLWERVPSDWAVYITGALLVALGIILRSAERFMRSKWNFRVADILR